jgi:tRNA dimethylallyltransferase
MATPAQRPSLVVIVGPTASGKSDLALKIAKNYSGEIIAADSRTIYKGMDIGTAKASAAEQAAVPHHGLDLVEPGQFYSAARFKKYAAAAVEDIKNRGRLPILVGGTGLYIDSFLFDFEFRPPPLLKERESLEKLSTGALQALIAQKGYRVPENRSNRRHLIRIVERKGQPGARSPAPRPDTLITGLMPDDKELKSRINSRAEAMFESGVISETEELLDRYGEEALMATGGIIYKVCLRFLKGEINHQEAVKLFQTADWQYARRQKTWFKRNPHIVWYRNNALAYEALCKSFEHRNYH